MTTTQDQPEPIARLLRFAGKTRQEVRNPNLTAREAIEVANYIANLQAASRDPLAMGRVPPCPYHCGWEGLHKIAVADGAYLARTEWPEDEEGVSVKRATVMRNIGYLIDVCRAMLAAAPRPPAAQENMVESHHIAPPPDTERAEVIYTDQGINVAKDGVLVAFIPWSEAAPRPPAAQERAA